MTLEAVDSDTEIRRTKVDLTGLMKVLSDHLYSTPLVAIRELVQNAHDSCHRRRLEDPEADPPRIVVHANAEAGQIEIEDNGAGLTPTKSTGTWPQWVRGTRDSSAMAPLTQAT